MVKTIIRKVSINKRTKQMSVTIPKKKFKKQDTTLKFDEDLFVELSILKKEKRKR